MRGAEVICCGRVGFQGSVGRPGGPFLQQLGGTWVWVRRGAWAEEKRL